MESIAIVGTGIAGMGAGYFLRDRYQVTFFEKNDYPGGHTHTLTIDEEGRPIYIDSGFMVYNEITYPHFTRLLGELNVETIPTSMSFSVSHVPSGLEYCGTGLLGLFAQRRNIFNPRFLRMLLQMDRFNRESIEVLSNSRYTSTTIAQYVQEKGFGEDFLNKYLVPMSSAVWSTPPDLMVQFPIVTLVRFFKNHGFLGLTTHYQWRTIKGGSRIYRDKILSYFKDKVFLKKAVVKILRVNGRVQIQDVEGTQQIYDKVILACHGDEALKILGDATVLERDLLQNFFYQKNRVTLHTDGRVMPKTRRAWSSWNYRIEVDSQGNLKPTTIYYMNSLQRVSQRKDYFISVNDPGQVDPQKVLWETEYEHPIYDLKAIQAQENLSRLNQNGTTFFCGSYFKYGFHEDALTSSLETARMITGERVWS